MSIRSINPGFFLRYFVTPAMALSVLTSPVEAQAASQSEARNAPFALVAADVQLEGKVNINTASAKELELLPGIGPSTAEKIIAYRAKYPFKESLHLLRVKGVGRKTFAKIKPFLSVEGASDLKKAK
jgi:competence ComEA-like helix-hairpin-helix protein